MPKKIDLSGQRFCRLMVLRPGPNSSTGFTRWYCRCDCGTEVLTYTGGLRNGHVRSCGCLQKEGVVARITTHGLSKTGAYKSWAAMWARCTIPTNGSYPNYGGRGVTVCDRWKSFENFFADMGERPRGKTLDRKKNEIGYGPDNCRWSTKSEQDNNKRNSVFVTVGERTQTYSQWARELGCSPNVLRARYLKFGTFDPIVRDRNSYLRKDRRTNESATQSPPDH